MEKAIKLSKLNRIDPTSVKILKELSEILDDREERVSYTYIMNRLNLTWNAVSKSIDRMVRDGIVQRRDGKLSVCGAIVTLYEPMTRAQ